MSIGSDELVSLDTPLSTRRQPYDVLLLDAESRQSLTIMRSLGRRGLRVAALASSNVSFVPSFSSRWCQESIVGPGCEETEDYLAYLERVVQIVRPHTLIASTAGTISLLHRYRTQLEQHTRVVLPGEPTLDITINRGRLLEIARELGLNLPKGVHIREASETDEALRLIGLPAVVRPVEVWGPARGVGLEPVLVTTPMEARLNVEAALNRGSEILFQQFFPGVQESISFFRAQGEILAQFAQRTKRASSPMGGLDVLRYSIAMPVDSSTQAAYLLDNIRMEGYCRVDFRRDYAGKPYLIDVDFSLFAGTELAVQAGVDFPYLLYQWSRGERMEKIPEYRVGVCRRDLAADFAATMAMVRQSGKPGTTPAWRAIRDFCTSFLVPMHYDYFDWMDISPAWTAARACFGGTYSKETTK